MRLVKIQKDRAYFRRFQVKFRRRREGKTDYYARKRMIIQDKNKYDCPKFRLVVRFSNKYVLCQIVKATIKGDEVICQAHSRELVRYGLTVGLKNYAAAYCTGLLVARRLLQQVGLDKKYSGQKEPDGVYRTTKVGKKTYYIRQMVSGRRPFRCILDVGIVSTSTGARVFGAMKGAVDGGLDVPHNQKRFPGYDRDSKEYDAEVHREHIFGGHVGGYMEYLMEEDEALYKEHFASYIAAGIGPEELEELIEKVHAAIRDDPSPNKSEFVVSDNLKKFKKGIKLTLEQRRANIAAKKAAIIEQRKKAEEEDE